MKIGDRIYNLRKIKCISQEELANKIGVSRQTISKWESKQSLPEIDKVALMSDYFGVTTDYLLKGIEEAPGVSKINAELLSMIGLVFNYVGLFISIAVWFEYQTTFSIAIALITNVIGLAVFFSGQYWGTNKEKAKIKFCLFGIWPIVIIPYSLLFNFIQGLLLGYNASIMPFPEMVGNSITLGLIGWLLYISICIVIDFICYSKYKQEWQ